MRKPPQWTDRVCKSFGQTLDGHQHYRVIWGPDREEIRYGKLCKRYDEIEPRWILEVFVPHEKYGAWDTESMGPKPPGGEYFISQIIQVDGQYVPMGTYGPETLKLLITCVEKGKALSEWEKKRWRDDQTQKQKAREHQRFEDVFADAMGPFGENAIAGIPGKRNSGDILIPDINKLSPELRARLASTAGSIKQL